MAGGVGVVPSGLVRGLEETLLSGVGFFFGVVVVGVGDVLAVGDFNIPGVFTPVATGDFTPLLSIPNSLFPTGDFFTTGEPVTAVFPALLTGVFLSGVTPVGAVDGEVTVEVPGFNNLGGAFLRIGVVVVTSVSVTGFFLATAVVAAGTFLTGVAVAIFDVPVVVVVVGVFLASAGVFLTGVDFLEILTVSTFAITQQGKSDQVTSVIILLRSPQV